MGLKLGLLFNRTLIPIFGKTVYCSGMTNPSFDITWYIMNAAICILYGQLHTHIYIIYMLAADVLNPGAPFSLVAMKVPADSMVAHMAHVCHMPATPKTLLLNFKKEKEIVQSPSTHEATCHWRAWNQHSLGRRWVTAVGGIWITLGTKILHQVTELTRAILKVLAQPNFVFGASFIILLQQVLVAHGVLELTKRNGTASPIHHGIKPGRNHILFRQGCPCLIDHGSFRDRTSRVGLGLRHKGRSFTGTLRHIGHHLANILGLKHLDEAKVRIGGAFQHFLIHPKAMGLLQQVEALGPITTGPYLRIAIHWRLSHNDEITRIERDQDEKHSWGVTGYYTKQNTRCIYTKKQPGETCSFPNSDLQPLDPVAQRLRRYRFTRNQILYVNKTD